jgi:hypothetical protein
MKMKNKMINNSTYFIFASKDLIEILTDPKNSITDFIEAIEEEFYSYTLYEYDPKKDNPAIILFKFIESGEDDYSTLTSSEFEKLKELI